MADGKLIFDTGIDSTGFQKGMGALGGVAKGAFNLTKKAILGATTVLAGFGAYSIKVGSDFDAAMSEVSAISGATGKDLEALRNKAKEMGSTTKFSATESAAALKYMGMAGWETEQMLDALPGVMNLAAASGEDLALVSDIVTDSMTAFGLEAKEAGRFADILAAAASSSNTNVGMLGESFKYVAPLAGALGYSAEDVSVALGLMANAGIKGSQAGTSLRSALTRLADPTKETQGMMDELGISITDVEGNMKPLNELLPELRASFKGMSEEQKAQAASTLFGTEAMSGMLAILNASDEEYEKLTESINNSTGAAEEMAKVMNDNLKGDITILKSAVEGLGIAFYEDMDSPLRDVVQKATGYVGQLSEAFGKKGFQGVVEAVGGIVADIATSIAKELPKLVRAGASLITSLIDGIKKDKDQIIEAANEAITTFLEAIFVLLPQIYTLGIELIVGLVQGMAQNIPELIPVAIHALETILSAFIENAPLLVEAGLQIIHALIGAVTENVGMVASAAVSIVTGIVTSIIENLGVLIPAALQMITAICDAVIENLPLIIDLALELILALIQGIIDSLPYLIENVPRIINSFTDAIMGKLPEIIKAGIDIILALIKGLIDSIPTIIANLPQIIMAIVNAFLLYNWWDLGKSLMTKLGEGIRSMFSSLGSAAKNLATNAGTMIKNAWSTAKTWASDMISKMISGISGGLGSVRTAALNVARGAWNAIKGLWSGAASIGKDFIRGIWSGISDMTDWIINLIGGFAKSVIGSIKNFFGISSPAKVLRDEVGKWLPPGIGEGFEDELPAMEKGMVGQLKGLGRKLKNAVQVETGNLSYALAGGSSATKAIHQNEVFSEIVDRKGQLYATLEVEGRPIAKATAEYTTEEQALMDKRRRA